MKKTKISAKELKDECNKQINGNKYQKTNKLKAKFEIYNYLIKLFI